MFEWKPLSEQGLRSIAESTARMNIWEGAVRSSKTICALLRWIEFVHSAPPGPLMMIGKTERTLKRNLLGPLKEMLGSKRYRENLGDGEIFINGRTVYLAGANDERAAEKIQGVTLAGCCGDELTLWPENLFKMTLSRLSVEGAAFFGTTNPDGPYHWLKTGFLDRADELDLRTWHFQLSDNLSLSQSYIDNLSREYTGLWYKRFILGLWVAAEGAIYDMFDEKQHVTADPVAPHKWFVAIDYGTANPFHALAACSTADGRLHVAHEWRYDSAAKGRSMTDAEYAEAVKDWLTAHGIKPAFVFIDPSAASFIEAARRAQIPGVWGADNAVLDGIRRTARLLTAQRLTISAECEELTKELMSYVWDPKAQEKGEDKPLKVNDHGCLVAGTRIQTSRGLVAIEHVQAGDRVHTRKGLKAVVSQCQTSPAAQVLAVHLSNGQVLTGTPDHPVYVRGKGFSRIDALRYGDIMQVWKQKSSYSTASSSDATRIARVGLTGCISRRGRQTGRMGCGGYTRNCGLQHTGQSQTAGTSTMRTSTHSTTTSQTCGACRSTSTKRYTGNAPASDHEPPALWSIWSASDRSRLSGTGVQRAAIGTRATARLRGRNASRFQRNARFAGACMRTSQGGTRQVFARTTARANIGGCWGWIAKRALAVSAGRTSCATSIPARRHVPVYVVGVFAVNEAKPVYNLAVEGQFEYYANGVLVHNCDALRYLVNGTIQVWGRWIQHAN